MQLASLGFLAGVIISQMLTVLPRIEWSFLIIVVLPLVFRYPAYRLVLCIFLGFLYSVFIAHDKLAGQISPQLVGQDLLLTGTIASIPDIQSQRRRFLVDVIDLTELNTENNSNVLLQNLDKYQLPTRLRLSWYHTNVDLHAGERWQWVVRLKGPRGFSNPGGFDYEGWLYRQDIHATGYVRDTGSTRSYNQRMGESEHWVYRFHLLREALADRIAQALQDNPYNGLVTALLVGHRSDISRDQWSVLTATGTSHLMAISGLHIGLVAGMVYWLVSYLWRRIPRAALYLSAPRAAAVGALFAALLYSALAGFTLPTQRAVIMVSIVMVAIWTQRNIRPSLLLSLAMLAVLLYDPAAVVSGSFWLSFGAVAVIFYTMVGRLPVKNWWWKWGRVQWVIAVGLFPILLYVFQQVPLSSPLANLVAVPVVSFVTVPFTLVGGALLFVLPGAADVMIAMAAWSLALLWPLLQGLAEFEPLLWSSGQPPVWALISALLGILWLLAPKGVPARWIGAFWLFPLVFFPRQNIENGAAVLTVLDVGHGLAAVVRTANHVLVYDAGPRYSAQFDAGDAIVVPYLQSQGIRSIDRLILSHDDSDHTGGFRSVISQLPVTRVMATPNVQLEREPSELCVAGKHWTWDGVYFQVLHPAAGFEDDKDNNWSCVLQISAQTDKILLTGDIEQRVEAQLVKYFAADDDDLRADVLVVPHHGSGSSSSREFIQAVQPEYALISVGYKNRYGLPKHDVLQRYDDIDAHILQTSVSGAISLTLGTDLRPQLVEYRQQSGHYWSNRGQ